MPTASKEPNPASNVHSFNVAQRLAQAVGTAREMGFDVRKIVLDDQTPGWCQMGDKKILFLDLTATTSEQLQQIDEIVASYCNQRSENRDGKMAA